MVPAYAEEDDVLENAGSEVIMTSPKSARHARPRLLTRILAFETDESLDGRASLSQKTYTLEIAMYHPLAVHIYQSPSNVCKLSGTTVGETRGQRREYAPTSSKRFASLWTLTKVLMFPLSIHSDIIANRCPPIVTPNSGSMFG